MMATIPARTPSGSESQRLTNKAKSGDFRSRSAKYSAEFSASLPRVIVLSLVTVVSRRFCKPQVNGPNPFGGFLVAVALRRMGLQVIDGSSKIRILLEGVDRWNFEIC